MHIVCLDLEGILIPEIWVAFAEKTGIDGFRRTTRDEPDYDALMRYRLDLLRKTDFRIDDFQEVIDTLDPLPGALPFLQTLQQQSRVIILSDTFEEFVQPLMAKLGFPTLFCHNLDIDPNGTIAGYRLRQTDQKRKAVEAFQALNFQVAAVGDSFNDLSMLQAADAPFFLNPAPAAVEKAPAIARFSDYPELLEKLENQLESWSTRPTNSPPRSSPQP